MRFHIGDDLISEWDEADRGHAISVRRQPLISRDSRVLTIGSCFAVEIRAALRARALDMYPQYLDIDLDLERETIARLPHRDNVNHYDTANIRQEFERALDKRDGVDEKFPALELLHNIDPKSIPGRIGYHPRFQDPYRKNVFGTDYDAVVDASRRLDHCFRDALDAADVYIVTLGHTETWQDVSTGRYVWSEKVRQQVANPENIQFRPTDFEDNYENLRWVCAALRERFPAKKVVLTVSPISLKKTFTDNDLVIANMYSKSVLRAAAGKVADDFDNVLYWPSYELALKMDLYREDGRHVSQEGIDFIVSNFLRAYSTL
jgi:cellulose biosynthesis protein BcsQ